MNRFLIFAGLCLALCGGAVSSRAEMLPSYEMDDLTFKAEAIVEGRVIASRGADYEQQLDLQVTHSWFGSLNTGQLLTADGMYLYLKRDPAQPSKDETFPPTESLGIGDRLVMFVFRTGLQRRKNLVAKENHWSVVASGVRLIQEKTAHDFWQLMNPGYYIEGKDDISDLNQRIEDSVRRVGELKTLLAKPDSPDDVPALSKWLAERKSLRHTRFWASSFGSIARVVEEKLKRIEALKPKTEGVM